MKKLNETVTSLCRGFTEAVGEKSRNCWKNNAPLNEKRRKKIKDLKTNLKEA